MRPAPLTVVKGGIDRGRPKGGIRADVLFDLVNAVITEEFKIGPRPGTVRTHLLPEGTVGLVAFDGNLHVFASEAVYPESVIPDGVRVNVLLHPTDPDVQLTEIHFAQPYLGALYVVAEFEDGGIFHYWLQQGEEWEADTEYSANEFVTPTTPNGYVYRALRLGAPYPAWTPGTPRTEGDGSLTDASIIEPTVYNEYYYTCIDTQGDNPQSGSVEPEWPTDSGATIIESTEGVVIPTVNDANPPTPPQPNQPQASTTDRYDR